MLRVEGESGLEGGARFLRLPFRERPAPLGVLAVRLARTVLAQKTPRLVFRDRPDQLVDYPSVAKHLHVRDAPDLEVVGQFGVRLGVDLHEQELPRELFGQPLIVLVFSFELESFGCDEVATEATLALDRLVQPIDRE